MCSPLYGILWVVAILSEDDRFVGHQSAILVQSIVNLVDHLTLLWRHVTMEFVLFAKWKHGCQGHLCDVAANTPDNESINAV